MAAALRKRESPFSPFQDDGWGWSAGPQGFGLYGVWSCNKVDGSEEAEKKKKKKMQSRKKLVKNKLSLIVGLEIFHLSIFFIR